MLSNIGLTDEARTKIAHLLNATLADVFVLYVKTRRFHWNVEAPNFVELHEFFEAQYEILDEEIDEVAERVRAIDHPAAGSMREYLQLARLSESCDKAVDARHMVSTLMTDHEALIRNLRRDLQTCADLGDAGNGDFLTGLLEAHEKMAWMLRAHLRG
jgi:starvation-inducible DNA-binding protein